MESFQINTNRKSDIALELILKSGNEKFPSD